MNRTITAKADSATAQRVLRRGMAAIETLRPVIAEIVAREDTSEAAATVASVLMHEAFVLFARSGLSGDSVAEAVTDYMQRLMHVHDHPEAPHIGPFLLLPVDSYTGELADESGEKPS